ncbi:PilZ domain-containing protein [Desulfonema magnum]|uniref:PilZ domain-containing protein n=1 Tax=Desulfonema magnum TaxID=45655 RepID=A0A975GQH7_9BACT|nr:PilZ domain-containing protein [Desulfonema magnum]QTA89877.1 PilZ domain-containing protein [Desulfonema magnum]
MEIYQKTKTELIEQLELMRHQMAELESKIIQLESDENKNSNKPITRPPRRRLHADIEFIADFDIIRAKGINISEGGICFELCEDLPFEMQFELEDELHQHRAHLIWVKRLSNGRYRFGFEFVPPEPYPQF